MWRRETEKTARYGMEPLWNRYGTAMESLWNRYGTAMEPLWNRYDTAMEPLWNRYGTAMAPLWNHYGTAMAPLWNLSFPPRPLPPLALPSPDPPSALLLPGAGHMSPCEDGRGRPPFPPSPASYR